MPNLTPALVKIREMLAAAKAAPKAVAKVKYLAPQEDALEIARMNAVRMLGLPENNTAIDRARALGFDTDAVHFSRHGVDVDVLDSGKYAVSPFDAVGTHVGTKEAAMDRFRNTTGNLDTPRGVSYPLLIRRGDEYTSPSGAPWSETDLMMALMERGGYNTARETYQSLNEKLRRDLFRGSGYGSIPYVNDVEAAGVTSYIVPPHNMRSRFAAFDPARSDEAGLLKARGGLAQMKKECSCGR